LLEGIAPKCAVDGDNPVGLVVSAGATEEVAFAIACSAELARLEVSTATTGASPDPDGYTLQIDGAAGQRIGANAALTITGLTAGDHTVRLSNIAPNCQVTGPNPTEVRLVPAEAAQVAFAIECPVPTGSIEATVVTLGFAAEFDGYTLSVDGDAERAIDRNGTVTFSGLGPGRHGVLLAGIASNCLLDGENPRVVEVASLATTALALQVACRVPVSDQILFSSDRSTVFPFSHVYRMRADGSEVVDLTPGADGEDGAWSPDGTRIAFTSYRDGNAEIYVMGADGIGLARLTRHPADDKEPTWSPDGRQIAFLSTGPGETTLRVMNADGTDARSIAGTFNGTSPSWSPDGMMIAFERFVRLCHFDVCVADIFLVPATGGSAVNLTNNADEVAHNPAWSPDGSTIAYEQESQIYTIRPDGTGRTLLSRNPAAQDVNPVWSPSGSSVAFTRYLENSEVFVMNADGTNVANLSNHPANDGASSWR
jgi:TolB protein